MNKVWFFNTQGDGSDQLHTRVKESTVHVLSWEIMSMLLPFTESGNPNNGVSFEDRKPGQALAMLSLKCLGDMQIDESRK